MSKINGMPEPAGCTWSYTDGISHLTQACPEYAAGRRMVEIIAELHSIHLDAEQRQ